MRESDYGEFAALLDGVCSLLSRGQHIPSAIHAAMWFRSLAAHDLGAVRAAFDAHVRDPQRGRFVPVPADILAQLAGAAADDGRPGPDEAWAIAVAGVDESATIVWTDEIAEAWGAARPIMALGDEVGARMAFLEVYARLLRAARDAGAPVRWSASLGHDPVARDSAIAEAARLGRIAERPAGAGALPAPRAALALGGQAGAHGPNAEVRARLMALRDRLLNPPPAADPSAIARAELADRKASASAAVTRYGQCHSGEKGAA